MGSPSTFLQGENYLTQLVAFNALFDAARAGEAARETAKAVQGAMALLESGDLVDPTSDLHLQRCYAILIEASDPPQHLS